MDDISVPRACGDDPEVNSFSEFYNTCSPRMRG